MNRNIVRFVLIFASIGTLIAGNGCNNGEFSRFAELPEAGWAYGDSILISTAGIAGKHQSEMTVALRHNDKFPYRNLWIEVSHPEADGKIHRDSINIELADIYGRWLGKGFGASYQCQATLPHKVNIPDSATVKIRHVMRVDTIHGIEQIGITLAEGQP